MTTWPMQAQVRQFFGEPGSLACTAGMVELAYPMRIAWDKTQIIRRFRCHEKVADTFQRVFTKTLDAYGLPEIQRLGLDLFGGCYNFRQMRGGASWSTHSWGIAYDLDPERNQLKWGRDRAAFAKLAFEPYWKIVEGEGLLSLGRAKNYDWMHVQAARV